MKITEKHIVKVTEEIQVGVKCDVCKKVIKGNDFENVYSTISRHHEWGNDSVDSIECFDVCSFVCYMEQLEKCCKKLRNFSTAEIDNKPIRFVEQMIKDYKKLLK